MKQLILHPTSLSSDDHRAFAHALRIALNDHTGMYIIHAAESENKEIDWKQYPAVRETLHKWGEIEAGVERNIIHDLLGLDIVKVEAKTKNIIDSIIHFRKQHNHAIDLIVVGTQGRKGLPRWLKPSTSEEIARKVNIPSLFVPYNAKGFVNADNGQASINNILIPIDYSPPAQIAATMTGEFLHHFKDQNPTITFLHVGDKQNSPEIDTHVFGEAKTNYQIKPGNPVDQILDTAQSINADLIVMISHGHDGFLDVVRGSVTERVLHESPCPLLLIPAR